MEKLVRKAMKGDSAAFIELIKCCEQSMYKTAWVYLKNEQDMADAIQETILTCFEKIHTLREPKYFKTWTIRILINHCNKILKKQNDFYELENVEQGSCDNEMETFEWQEVLLSLEESSRIIVQLYYYEELSIKEIADILKMNKNTVTTKLSRARKKLRDFL